MGTSKQWLRIGPFCWYSQTLLAAVKSKIRFKRAVWPLLVLVSAIPRILGAFFLPNGFGDAYVYIRDIGTLSTKLSTGAFRSTTATPACITPWLRQGDIFMLPLG